MASDKDPDNCHFEENALSSRERINGGGSTEEIITRVEHDLEFATEKLLNLEIFSMEVASKATDIEPIPVDDENVSLESFEKALEFDILCGILDSEVKEIDSTVSSLQMDIADVDNKVFEDQSADKIGEKLRGAKRSLNQIQDAIAAVRNESVKFARFIDLNRDSEWSGEHGGYGNGDPISNVSVLQSLNESIAGELELEKQLSDSKSVEEELNLKLRHLEQEKHYWEELIEELSERMFAAENASELFYGISKELISKLNILEFNLSASKHQEQEVRSKLEETLMKFSAAESAVQNRVQELEEQLRESDNQLQSSKASVEAREEQQNVLQNRVQELEEQLRESDNQLQSSSASVEAREEQQNLLHSELSTLGNDIKNLKDNLSKAEGRAQNAEARCMDLTKSNIELNEELDSLRNQGSEEAKVLERRLNESDTQLEHAKASVEANVEQQNVLKSTMSDMEHAIEDLKGKASKAESRAESAESKCNTLTETNLELNEELGFLKSRMESLEKSLRQSNNAKVSAVKDIGIRTKIIAELVTKLASERERLHLQIVTLTKKNKILAQKCKGNAEGITLRQESTCDNDELDYIRMAEEILPRSPSKETLVESITAETVRQAEAETDAAVEDESGAELETVRNIQPTLLNWKYLFVAFLVLLSSVLVYLLYQEGNGGA